MLHRLATLLWVTRAISQEKAVKLQLVEIIIPRYANHLDATSDQTTDDVCFHAAIDKDHAL